MAILSMNTSKRTIPDFELYEPQSLHHELPILWEMAEGYYVWDIEGRKYLDFTSGIFVANTGHNPSAVRKAIIDQSRKLLHSYVFPNQPRIDLVKKLVEMTGMDKVFLCSTGSEAVEAAIRCMGGLNNVIALDSANHGRTMGSQQITRNGLTYNDHPPLRRHIKGIIFETYFGWSAQFHPVAWVQEWCNWAKQNNIPVCFDEIQAGFGRTGKLFGYEHYGVKPDLICVGKALGGGLPISAVIGRADLLDAPDDLSSTHTGNPVCCAAALANLAVLEQQQLVKRAAEMGKHIERWLLAIPHRYVWTGKGMVWAIDLKDIELANRVVDLCSQRGLLLVKTHRGTIKIGAPLIISKRAMKQGINIICEVLNEVN